MIDTESEWEQSFGKELWYYTMWSWDNEKDCRDDLGAASPSVPYADLFLIVASKIPHSDSFRSGESTGSQFRNSRSVVVYTTTSNRRMVRAFILLLLLCTGGWMYSIDTWNPDEGFNPSSMKDWILHRPILHDEGLSQSFIIKGMVLGSVL